MNFRSDSRACDLWIALYFFMLGFIAFVAVFATYMDFMTTMYGLRADPHLEANPAIRQLFATQGPQGLYFLTLKMTSYVVAGFLLAIGFVLVARFFSVRRRYSMFLYALSVVIFLSLVAYVILRLIVVYNNFWNVYFMTGGG